MSKRIKSFLISAASVFVTALAVVVLTPEWATFVQDVYGWVTEAGLPASLVAVVGLIVAEVWKSILNKRAASKAGYHSAAVASRNGLDLY